MGKTLNFNQRLRLDGFMAEGKFRRMDRFLARMTERGVDTAPLPWQLLDGALSAGEEVDFTAMAQIAPHAGPARAPLFTAVMTALAAGNADALADLVQDAGAAPLQRFEAMGWRVFLSHRAEPPTQGCPVAQVVQFWDTPTPPDEITRVRPLWQALPAPHIWVDDRGAEAFIRDEFGADAARTYAGLWHPAVKSDLFRLYFLAARGGLYADADSRPGTGIEAFLAQAGGGVWAGSTTGVPNCVAQNGFLSAPAGHPFILDFLDHVLANLRDPQGRGITWLAGPAAMTGFLHRHLGKYELGLIPAGRMKAQLFRQIKAAYKQTELNWRVHEHRRGMTREPGLRATLEALDSQG
jgi:hypothetical protein